MNFFCCRFCPKPGREKPENMRFSEICRFPVGGFRNGGEGGIRTLGTRKSTTVFEFDGGRASLSQLVLSCAVLLGFLESTVTVCTGSSRLVSSRSLANWLAENPQRIIPALSHGTDIILSNRHLLQMTQSSFLRPIIQRSATGPKQSFLRSGYSFPESRSRYTDSTISPSDNTTITVPTALISGVMPRRSVE